jgi:hypothetical protein
VGSAPKVFREIALVFAFAVVLVLALVFFAFALAVALVFAVAVALVLVLAVVLAVALVFAFALAVALALVNRIKTVDVVPNPRFPLYKSNRACSNRGRTEVTSMRSGILRFSLEMGLLSLAACGIGACSSDDIHLGTGASGTTTGTGGAGGMGGAASSTQAVVVSTAAGTLSGGTGGSGAGGPGGPCPDTWLMTYDVTGKIAITDTPSGLGDTVKDIGPGTLQIRFPNANGAPIAGYTTLVSYHMPMQYQVDTDGLVVTTDLTVDTVDECGIAAATPIGYLLNWAMCQYNPMAWTTQLAGTGPGCVRAYHTTGNINCNDMSMLGTCMDAMLMDGDNPQDLIWDQPFNTFEFAMDLKSFQMQNLDGPAPPAGVTGVEFPNDSPGRTWLSLSAVETGRVLGATPACACPP